MYVPGAEGTLPALVRLAQHASRFAIPLISTVDAHSENDREFAVWKPHCVVGTFGQQKPSGTLLSSSVAVSSAPVNQVPGLTDSGQVLQFIIEKQHTDCFSNRNLKPILDMLRAARYVVYGVVTEICVQQAVLGLLSMGAQVHLVTDAVRSLNPAKAEEFFDTLKTQGGVLTSVAAVTA